MYQDVAYGRRYGRIPRRPTRNTRGNQYIQRTPQLDMGSLHGLSDKEWEVVLGNLEAMLKEYYQREEQLRLEAEWATAPWNPSGRPMQFLKSPRIDPNIRAMSAAQVERIARDIEESHEAVRIHEEMAAYHAQLQEEMDAEYAAMQAKEEAENLPDAPPAIQFIGVKE